RSLQGKFILIFIALVIVTNGLFAVVGFSRENIYTANEAVEAATFLGNIMQRPAAAYFDNGNSEILDRIVAYRTGIAVQLKVTLYDANWWRLWGDETRIPPEGFPDLRRVKSGDQLNGSGIINREILFPLNVAGRLLGTIAIGIPHVDLLRMRNTGSEFTLILILGCIIGMSSAILLSRSLLEKLEQLTDAIESFGKGDYSVQVASTDTGEIKDLADSFNRMALTVQETFRENLQRNRIIDEKLQELWEIYELTRNMSLSVEFGVILEKFLEKAQTLSFSCCGQIVLQNRYSQKLEPAVSSEQLLNVVHHEVYENALNSCFLDGALIEAEIESCSMIFVPLIAANRVKGVLFLSKNDRHGYSDGVRRFLETIAPVAASLIENAALYEELAIWNQHMKNILASINSGLFAVDRKAQFIVNNEQLRNITEAGDFSFIGAGLKSFCEHIPDRNFAAELSATVENYLNLIFAKEPEELRVCKELELNVKTGKRVVEILLTPLYSNSDIRGVVTVINDISEQKNREQQMIETEKWAVLGRLAASVAHEIRNPLVAIQSLVEIIGDEVQGDLKEHARVVLGEVHRLNRVVAELLSMVRPEMAHLRKCNLKDIINELLLLVRHEAARSGVKLVVNFPDDLRQVSVDAEKIKQAILNILLNGIQAMKDGGQIDIGLSDSESRLQVSIANNGPEIPPDLRERIFEPFFTTKASGTGLGLAITRKIVELHGGLVELESDAVRTEFRIILSHGDVNGQADR
ncbi:MAG: multi-sensor signal transduction histidine kinase, partial [uncultured bacterium]